MTNLTYDSQSSHERSIPPVMQLTGKCRSTYLRQAVREQSHSLVIVHQLSLKHPVLNHEKKRLAHPHHSALHQASHEGVTVLNVRVQARRQCAPLVLTTGVG